MSRLGHASKSASTRNRPSPLGTLPMNESQEAVQFPWVTYKVMPRYSNVPPDHALERPAAIYRLWSQRPT